jgi:hypothetical protein
MILTGLRTNPAMKVFFDAIENGKKILEARKAEIDGVASYVVSNSHAALHKRLVEDSIDKTPHIFHKLRPKRTSEPTKSPFRLCPIKIQYSGVVIRFLWDSSREASDPALATYLESILCNAQPPIKAMDLQEFIQRIIVNDVSPQLEAFRKLNNKIWDVMDQFGSLHDGLKIAHKPAPQTVSTRKNNSVVNTPANSNPSDPLIKIPVMQDLVVEWDVLTPDIVTEDFCRELENVQSLVASPDALFTIIDASLKHRASILSHSSMSTKRQPHSKIQPQGDSLGSITEDDVLKMDIAVDEYSESILPNLFNGSVFFSGPRIRI